jgi:dihydrofolate reductase
MRRSILVAMSENGVIGRDNQLPWHLSADLKRFKALTMGHHLVMGRKTFESVGQPLPGRTTIVLTRELGYRPQGVLVAGSLNDALTLSAGDDEVFLVGGGDVFRQILPVANRMYVTLVHARIDGDVFFPQYDVNEWVLEEREDHVADEKNEYPFSFLTWNRR